MWPNRPKLAGLAQKTSHFNCFHFCECVHLFQEKQIVSFYNLFGLNNIFSIMFTSHITHWDVIQDLIKS